jgi:hypothetical protein
VAHRLVKLYKIAARCVTTESFPVEISSLGSELSVIVKKMPASSSLPLTKACGVEMREVLSESGVSKHIIDLIVGAELGSAEFSVGISLGMKELASSLSGKVLGSSWPRTPGALGLAFKEAACNGTFRQLNEAEPVAPTSPRPSRPCPMRSRLRTRSPWRRARAARMRLPSRNASSSPSPSPRPRRGKNSWARSRCTTCA